MRAFGSELTTRVVAEVGAALERERHDDRERHGAERE